MKALVGNSLSHQSCRLIVALIIIICIDSAASFIIYVYLIYFTSAAPVHPSNHEDKNKNDQREGERDRETDKYCLKMLLCLLLECCLKYLSASNSIPRRSINFHTAQPHIKTCSATKLGCNKSTNLKLSPLKIYQIHQKFSFSFSPSLS